MTGDLTKSELVGILEIIEAAQACIKPEDHKRLLLKTASLVEADSCACGIIELGRDRVAEPIFVVNGSYPEEMLSNYVSSRMYLQDPVIIYHLNFSGARPWSEIFREVDEKGARQVIDYAQSFNISYGVSGSVFVPEIEGLAVFGFAGKKNRFRRRHCRIVDILTSHLNGSLLEVSGFRRLSAAGAPFNEVPAQI